MRLRLKNSDIEVEKYSESKVEKTMIMNSVQELEHACHLLMTENGNVIQTLRAFRQTIPVVLCISIVVAMYVLFGMLNVLTLL